MSALSVFADHSTGPAVEGGHAVQIEHAFEDVSGFQALTPTRLQRIGRRFLSLPTWFGPSVSWHGLKIWLFSRQTSSCTAQPALGHEVVAWI
jgi:hypothetical protein